MAAGGSQTTDMENPIRAVGKWLGDIVKTEVTKPITEINTKLDSQQKAIDKLVKWQEAESTDGIECDLAILDDRICQMIRYAREKGYTTAEERRRCARMHNAYHKRGGNDGETEEYRRFLALPAEEEWRRNHD